MYKNNNLFLLEDVLLKDIMEQYNELDSYYGYEFKESLPFQPFKYDALNGCEIIDINFSIKENKEIDNIYIEFIDKINYHFERKNIEFSRGFTCDYENLNYGIFNKKLDEDIKLLLDNVLTNFEEIIKKENDYNILINKDNI